MLKKTSPHKTRFSLPHLALRQGGDDMGGHDTTV